MSSEWKSRGHDPQKRNPAGQGGARVTSKSQSLDGAENSKYHPDESLATPVLNASGEIVGFINVYPTAVHAFDADGNLVGFFATEGAAVACLSSREVKP